MMMVRRRRGGGWCSWWGWWMLTTMTVAVMLMACTHSTAYLEGAGWVGEWRSEEEAGMVVGLRLEGLLFN
jgi:hypothetical protein